MPHPAVERQIEREEERYGRDYYDPKDPPCEGCGRDTEILGARLCFSCEQSARDLGEEVDRA